MLGEDGGDGKGEDGGEGVAGALTAARMGTWANAARRSRAGTVMRTRGVAGRVEVAVDCMDTLLALMGG